MSAVQTQISTIKIDVENSSDDDYEKEELKVDVPTNVAHLLKEPTEIICPACEKKNLTRIEINVVTWPQQLLAILNILACKRITWEGRHDVNHYCSNCGCYIGRYIKVDKIMKQIFMMRQEDYCDLISS